MGWTGHELPAQGWHIYTRGGCNGVFIQKISQGGDLVGERIDIPEDTLYMLLASEMRSRKIAALEDMTDEQILGLAD